MAKIVLISKILDSTTLQMAQAIKNQQHDVTLITSIDSKVESKDEDYLKGIETLYFFKNWSFSESLKILPVLFHLQPNVIHLILQQAKLNFAQSALGVWSKVLPHCVLSMTLLEIKNGLSRKNLTRYMVEYSDIVTCPNLEGLGELRGLDIKSRKQKRSILAPVITLNKDENSNFQQESVTHHHKFLWDQFSNYLVIPFFEKSFQPNDPFFERMLVLASFRPVILWGTYEHWSLRERKTFSVWLQKKGLENQWAVTGELSEQETHYLLKKSCSLILAGMTFYPQEFIGYVNQAVQNHVSLIIDSQQSSLHAQLWRDGINCWIWEKRNLNRDLQRWIHLSDHTLKSNLEEFLKEEWHILDSPFNELNRLYTRAMAEI